ncbi:MAG: hypothetical protein NE328_09015 [Lentisphaeraceae bacterium]|nr:hypothetical protein [Lentisphaeraceae bacterium]
MTLDVYNDFIYKLSGKVYYELSKDSPNVDYAREISEQLHLLCEGFSQLQELDADIFLKNIEFINTKWTDEFKAIII